MDAKLVKVYYSLLGRDFIPVAWEIIENLFCFTAHQSTLTVSTDRPLIFCIGQLSVCTIPQDASASKALSESSSPLCLYSVA